MLDQPYLRNLLVLVVVAAAPAAAAAVAVFRTVHRL